MNYKRNQNGDNDNMPKLTNEQVEEIVKRINGTKKERDAKIAKDYSVTPKTIRNIRLNITWGHIKRDIS